MALENLRVCTPPMTTAPADASRPLPRPLDDGTWFGHPKGLTVLFFTEMWERLSYYGMRSLLVLYMVNHLFVRPDQGAEILGFNALKGALENSFGVMTPQALSSQIYGLYTGFVYLAPLFGGLLADRLIGRHRAVLLGGTLMAIGHFLMASEDLFLLALVALIAGNGCFKPNISTQVGALYAADDPRRDRAFTIFYVGVNVGAFLAPLICGTLGQMLGWHWGFGSAGVGMVLGLVVYLLNHDKLVKEPPPALALARPAAPWAGVAAYVLGVPLALVLMVASLGLPPLVPTTAALLAVGAGAWWVWRLPGDERPRVAGLVAACLMTAAFWGIYEQQGNTLQLWADESTHWPTVFGFTIPSTWYQSFNPLAIWCLVPLLNGLWAWQARRGSEPGSLNKMALGCVIMGLGYIVMIAAAEQQQPGIPSSVMWLVASTVVFTIGEIYLSPIGLSFVTQVAPARLASMMMGVWYLSSFFGNYASGYLGSFYGEMPKTHFFGLMCAIGVGVGLLMFLLSRPLARATGTR
jgi:POT family proton-dependent oligopeptide transporter